MAHLHSLAERLETLIISAIQNLGILACKASSTLSDYDLAHVFAIKQTFETDKDYHIRPSKDGRPMQRDVG